MQTPMLSNKRNSLDSTTHSINKTSCIKDETTVSVSLNPSQSLTAAQSAEPDMFKMSKPLLLQDLEHTILSDVDQVISNITESDFDGLQTLDSSSNPISLASASQPTLASENMHLPKPDLTSDFGLSITHSKNYIPVADLTMGQSKSSTLGSTPEYQHVESDTRSDSVQHSTADDESLVLVNSFNPGTFADEGLQGNPPVMFNDSSTDSAYTVDASNEDKFGRDDTHVDKNEGTVDDSSESIQPHSSDDESGCHSSDQEIQHDTHIEKDPVPLLVELIDSIFTPGLSPRVQLIMHIAFAGLVLNFAFLLYLSNLNPHVIFLFCISICLWASVAWFLSMVPEPDAVLMHPDQSTSENTFPVESKKDI
ncbi:hypothetical protein QVD99_002804 [Batrachochytrium dendrobatidis]|nr:hypothetical protein QVD99_002804 [Batrachochytrium dendrobatidis]